MYAIRLALALAELGARVIPLCNQPKDFQERLNETLNLAEPAKGRGYRERICQPQPVHLVPIGRGPNRRVNRLVRANRHFGIIGKQLRRWQKQHGKKIDQVFFAWMYDDDFRDFRHAQHQFGFPWTGLYYNSRPFRMPGKAIPYTGGLSCPERFVPLPSCRGIAVADPWIIPALQSLAGPDKRVVAFPDFTDLQLEPPSGLPAKVKAMAGNRRIISLVGHLQRTKGLVEFTAALQRSELKEAFFFLGGEIYWGEIDTPTRMALQRSWEDAPNLYCHLQRLSSEACLNQMIQISDVIYAAYSDFPNTSNIMTKAALLKKPILVSDGHLMADLAKQYSLGEVAPEGDVDTIAGTLHRMIQDPYLDQAETNSGWQAFAEQHTPERLRSALIELLADG
ncbi:glycosyltransferase [Synechococcus sp. CCY 9618]|uniref:glycosyltransferase n=1 Tax=Synechococcus sp. CCY 9618 TaxID=2815602 RepID=UPI001C22860B|nr:glycosyltransferase [Synechococcus sp. CCY 9618]